jgi:hypothetical protein
MEYKIVKLNGMSLAWEDAFMMGDALEEEFPGCDGHDFCCAISYNDGGPLDRGGVISMLKLVKQGERDESDWIWEVTLTNGEVWVAQGWCDYTGWDCQSSLVWEQKLRTWISI